MLVSIACILFMSAAGRSERKEVQSTRYLLSFASAINLLLIIWMLNEISQIETTLFDLRRCKLVSRFIFVHSYLLTLHSLESSTLLDCIESGLNIW